MNGRPRPFVTLTTTGAAANEVASLVRSAIIERGWDLAQSGTGEQAWIRITGRSQFDRGTRSAYEISASRHTDQWEIRWRPPSTDSVGELVRSTDIELPQTIRDVVSQMLPHYSPPTAETAAPASPRSGAQELRARVEELIGRCSLLLLERDDLIQWIDQLRRRNRQLTADNGVLREAIADAHGSIDELRGYVEVLRAQIAADRSIQPGASKHAAHGTSRAARVFEGAMAGVLSGLLVLAATGSGDEPPVTNQEISTIVVEIENSCADVVRVVEELPESN